MLSWWENGFTEEELDAICSIGERKPPKNSMIGVNSGTLNEKVRNSIISWIEPEGWLAERLEYIARQLNGKYFGLDLWGFGENFQYTTYKYDVKKKIEQHYDWHMDQGSSEGPPRKLSLVLQLSDPSEYEGGELQIMTGNSGSLGETCRKQKGIIYAFPSYLMHRVTPVTKGIRRTLVVWISGPKFR